MDLNVVDNVLAALQSYSIGQFLITLLSNESFASSSLRQLFVHEWPELLRTLATTPALKNSTVAVAKDLYTSILTDEITLLANKESGWHISARHARSEQLARFSVEGMSQRLQLQAPLLWDMLGLLLESDPSRSRRRTRFFESMKHPGADGSTSLGLDSQWDEEDEYWWGIEMEFAHDEEVDISRPEQTNVEPLRKKQRKALDRRAGLLRIVRCYFKSNASIRTDLPIASRGDNFDTHA